MQYLFCPLVWNRVLKFIKIYVNICTPDKICCGSILHWEESVRWRRSRSFLETSKTAKLRKKLSAAERDAFDEFAEDLNKIRREMITRLGAAIKSKQALEEEGVELGTSYSTSYPKTNRQLISYAISLKTFETYLDGFILVTVACGSEKLLTAVLDLVKRHEKGEGVIRSSLQRGVECVMPAAPLRTVAMYQKACLYVFERDQRKSLWD